MPTVVKNFQFYPGEDISIPDTIYQADGVTPQNISGWSVQFVMWPQDLPGTIVVTKTVGAGIVLTTPLSGLLTVTLAHADTISLAPGTYRYKIERTDAGFDARVTTGILTLLP